MDGVALCRWLKADKATAASLRAPGYDETTNAHPPNAWLPTIAKQSEPACHSFRRTEVRSAVRYAIASKDGTRQQQSRIDDRSGHFQFPDQTRYGKSLNARAMESAPENRTGFDHLKVDSAEQGHQRLPANWHA
jgi:hypothetical protein